MNYYMMPIFLFLTYFTVDWRKHRGKAISYSFPNLAFVWETLRSIGSLFLI